MTIKKICQIVFVALFTGHIAYLIYRWNKAVCAKSYATTHSNIKLHVLNNELDQI